MNLNINDTFNKELPADKITEKNRRQVLDACFSFVTPRVPSQPKLIHYSSELAIELGITKEDIKSELFLNTFSGVAIYPNTKPFAMCYGGHQFGNWAGQLGDGRAINLFEVEYNNKHWALQLKGAGETPYSRTADGFAVLRSSIREHLCSEAMYHLGVPTTRSLSLTLTGDDVLRDVMYDGHPAYEKGAVVCRVAPSFIRFGNFQILAARGDEKILQQLTDYTIKHHFAHIENKDKAGYLQFFREVVDKTVIMVVAWQRVGFVHGVMNTDNMSALGLTIDYGPYGWIENYDTDWTPNTTDAHGKRYRFGNQANIALWNLVQLANALFPLINDAPALETILHDYTKQFDLQYANMMLQKIGLRNQENKVITQTLEKNLTASETDMTIFFRKLSSVQKDIDTPESSLNKVWDAFYNPKEINNEVKENWLNWFNEYIALLKTDELNDTERALEMNTVNPKYVLRNYMAQLAIDAANKEDYTLINELHTLLKQPYSEQPENEKWFVKRPDWAREKIGCSMLSCSS